MSYLFVTHVDGACNLTYLKDFIRHEEARMKKKKDQIGGYHIKVPELVTKLGLVMDAHKFAYREELWLKSETQAADVLLNFNPKDRFFEETIREGGLVYQFRYYTPATNREQYVAGQH